VTFVGPVFAVEYNPGVSVGQYVKYGNFYGVGIANAYSWQMIEVISVSGKDVTLFSTGQYKNGTALPALVTVHNLETGATNETHSDLKSIIPANMNEGDVIPPGNFAVNSTETRKYMGVSRVVNVLTEQAPANIGTVTLTVIYDKASGMALEWQTWWTNKSTGLQQAALGYEVIDTNIFEIPNRAALIPTPAFYALIVVAVIVPATAAVILVRRKPKTKTKVLDQKVMNLTYNLNGINRGECYLSDSLQNCLKIISELKKRNVSIQCIIREDPELITKNYNLKLEDIVLMSSHPIKGFRALSSLQEISIEITKVLKAGVGAILLDGLEFLVARFGFNAVFMFLAEKHIEFVEGGAILLVPVNMETLDSREKGQLLSELKLL
jgi:hypothetical protein